MFKKLSEKPDAEVLVSEQWQSFFELYIKQLVISESTVSFTYYDVLLYKSKHKPHKLFLICNVT
jgi:hypothetical protein